MKIYIITEGEYSDYHIEAVFIDKTKADEYVRLYQEYNIEEYETDDDNIDIGEYKVQKYLVVSYTDNKYGSDGEDIQMYIRQDNTHAHPDLNKYPYKHKRYFYYDWNNNHNITLNTSINDDYKINEKDREKYLRICRDYVAKAKSLHDIEGIPYKDISNILFRQSS